MSEISSDHIQKLASLARIELTAEERQRFASQLSPVVEYVEQLSAVDTSSIMKVGGVSGLSNVYAQDIQRDEADQCAVTRATLLSGVPATSGEYIEVRAVMGSEVISA